MKKVTIVLVTYDSFAAAWRHLHTPGVTYALARKRLSRGWTPRKSLVTPPIPPVNRRAGII